MPFGEHIAQLYSLFSPLQLLMGLGIALAMQLALPERRLALLALLGQYLLVALLIAPQLLRSLVLIRMGLGLTIVAILYLTASRTDRELRSLGMPITAESPQRRAPWQGIQAMNMGTVFRLMVLAMASLAAYGMWRTRPLEGIPAATTFSAYWLIWAGLLITLTNVEPLQLGMGLLTIMNGFEILYLFLEKSLLVMGLLGVLAILLALAVVVCAEAWLGNLQDEASI
jgi:hypothetical protein